MFYIWWAAFFIFVQWFAYLLLYQIDPDCIKLLPGLIRGEGWSQLLWWFGIRFETTHQVTLSGSDPGNYQKTSHEFVKLLFQEVYLAWSLSLQADNTNISPPWYLPLSVAGFGSGSSRTLDIKSHHFNSMSRSMLSRTWLRHQLITMMMLCCMWWRLNKTHYCPFWFPTLV